MVGQIGRRLGHVRCVAQGAYPAPLAREPGAGPDLNVYITLALFQGETVAPNIPCMTGRPVQRACSR
jgi:hypothetical protein